MWTTAVDGIELGVVGTAVGAPFAVLVAEQLAAGGAGLVISVTSAGQISQLAEPPYVVLIERAWRDEGTSAHYQPPAPWSTLDEETAHALLPVTVHGSGRVRRDGGGRDDAVHRALDAFGRVVGVGPTAVEPRDDGFERHC